ncbi:MAG: hypothetical protein ACPLRM_07670, partial [Anaerolineae bacterium]
MSWRAIPLPRWSSRTTAVQAGPRYSYPTRLVLSIAASVLLGKKRSFCGDAQRLIAGIQPEPRVENAHLIPREDAFIVVTNHYYKPGYGVWWGIALITAAIAQARNFSEEIVWLMTNRWTYPDALRHHLVTPITHVFFTRLAQTYGFIPMPPMPPQPQYLQEGVCGVRQVLSVLSNATEERKHLIGLAPEGRDSHDGSLIEPPPGNGRLLLRMASYGWKLLPVGVAEIDGVLTTRFGPPFVLNPWPEVGKEEQDRRASTQVMTAIGAQLPPALWGVYRADIEALFSA